MRAAPLHLSWGDAERTTTPTCVCRTNTQNVTSPAQRAALVRREVAQVMATTEITRESFTAKLHASLNDVTVRSRWLSICATGTTAAFDNLQCCRGEHCSIRQNSMIVVLQVRPKQAGEWACLRSGQEPTSDFWEQSSGKQKILAISVTSRPG